MTIKNVLIIIAVLLSLANCFAQPSIGAERIQTLCNSMEKDFRKSVIAKVPKHYKYKFKYEDKEKEEWRMLPERGFIYYLKYAYSSKPKLLFQDINGAKPVVTSKTVKEGTLLRIGEGHLKWVKARTCLDKTFMNPEDIAEAAYYFLNNELIATRIRFGITDYNFCPSRYWIMIVNAETLFSDENSGKTCYYWHDGPCSEGSAMQFWEGYMSRRNIDATPERARQLYHLFLSDAALFRKKSLLLFQR
jgi:hypothetical protein